MRFSRLTLRTTDVAAARSFYAAVLGDDSADVIELHEESVARGARPHWLGQIGVDDVDGMTDAFIERGAARLGPTIRRGENEIAIVRDPGGAVVAVASASEVQKPLVAWHILHTQSLERCVSAYASLFGWHFHDHVTVAGETFHRFAWSPSQAPAGSFTDITGRPANHDRHPHWLFFFPTAALAGTIAEVEKCGGRALVPPEKPNIAICHDAQGAAFGLMTT